jgi:hypothetical protein
VISPHRLSHRLCSVGCDVLFTIKDICYRVMIRDQCNFSDALLTKPYVHYSRRQCVARTCAFVLK